ncbi:MAG TPA: ABC transporter permease [Oscillatoriaceae cyanobacterium]
MKWRRVRAVTRKEFLHIRRDPRSAVLSVLIPILLLGLFGWALSLDVENVPMVVWDQSDTATSRTLVARFAGSPYFRVSAARSYRAIEQAIGSEQDDAALVISPGLGERSAGPVALQLLVNGADPVRGGLMLNYAQAVVAAYGDELARARVAALGLAPPAPPFELRTRVWYNPDLETRNALVPGLIAMILAIIASLLTALTIAREWETGTMESLIATPVTGPELILGKLAPYFVIGMIDVTLAIAMGRYVFHVPLVGSPLLVFGAAIVYMGATLGFGMLVSVVARSQLLASQMAFVATLLPSFLLSGLVFPIASMPMWLQVLSTIFPARYFIAILRGIYLKGLDVSGLAYQFVMLAVFAIAALALAVRAFRRKLA